MKYLLKTYLNAWQYISIISIIVLPYQPKVFAIENPNYTLIDKNIVEDISFISSESGKNALGRIYIKGGIKEIKEVANVYASSYNKAYIAAHFRCCDGSLLVCNALEKDYSRSYKLFNKKSYCSQLVKTASWSDYKKTNNIPEKVY